MLSEGLPLLILFELIIVFLGSHLKGKQHGFGVF